MREKEYKFNPDTLSYEVVQPPVRVRSYRFVRNFLLGFIAISILNICYSYKFYTPKLERIERENQAAMARFELLDGRVEEVVRKIAEIKQRDNNVYRALFAADTLSIDGIYDSYPESYYSYMSADPYGVLLTDEWKKIDAASRLLYLESKSLDQLQAFSKDKERMSLSIPAIWPIDKRNLHGNIGAYGRRLHPIYHRYLMHYGIDMGGRTGDPVYATGNGVVESTDKGQRRRGYGQQIFIDHGFGYGTRYAHLSKILVEPGQKVVRGELIGEVGSTGGSTGPHLHYEVLLMGKNVDPINYFRRDMDEAEMERIIESAKATTYETIDE